jgi:hypothetical protein
MSEYGKLAWHHWMAIGIIIGLTLGHFGDWLRRRLG